VLPGHYVPLGARAAFAARPARSTRTLALRLRSALALFTVCVVWATAPFCTATASYPDKPVRVIVPAAAGSRPDRVAHLVTPLLGAYFGERFIVDNRSGAHGLMGTELAARATPDGCTLLIGMPATLTTTAFRRLRPPYDAKKDFAPIGMIATSPFVLAVHPSVPATTVDDLLSLARSKRSRLAYGVGPRRDAAQGAMELLQRMARIDLKHNDYPARAELLGNLIAGQVNLALLEVSDALDHLRARRLRPLAVTTARRSAALPYVPTTAESGLAGFEASRWTGLLAPARTPADIVGELGVGLRRALANPGVRWQLAQEGLQPGEGEAGAFERIVARELADYAKLAKPSALRWP
jgi:tripartite-type tricarboxylate transporter receptor subunit TctC